MSAEPCFLEAQAGVVHPPLPLLASTGSQEFLIPLGLGWGHTAASALSHMFPLYTCVQSSLFLCVECVHVYSQACGDQKSILVSSSSILHLAFGGRLSIKPELTDLTRLSGQLALGTLLPVILHLLGLQAHTTKPNPYVGAEDLNPGPHTCAASTLPTEPSP